MEISVAHGGRFEPAPERSKIQAGACEQCILVAEADHRIANHLAVLSGYVRLKAADLAARPADLNPGNVRLALMGIEAQIAAVGRLHRSLARNGRFASADLSGHLHTICAPYIAGLSGAIRLTEDFSPGCLVSPDHVLPLTQIVSEVITNAIKHAHIGDQPGVVLVRCSKDGSGTIRVEVVDDGGGLPEGIDPQTGGGFGFSLVRALARKLGAFAEFHSTREGLHFQISVSAAPASLTTGA